MKTIPQHQEIKIDPKKLCCPICGEALTVDIDEWEQYEDGTWGASETGVHCSCITEPDFDDDNYDEWLNHHFNMPYVDWLPIDTIVYVALKKHVRFEMEKQEA